MFTAIRSFFSAALKLFLGFLTGLFNWVRKHPRTVAEIVVGVLIALAAWHFTTKHTTEKVWAEANVTINAQKAEIEKANAENAARNAKIERIEKESKQVADALSKEIEESRKATKQIVADYDRKLAEEKKKYQVVHVTDPGTGKAVEVNINPQGEVVCQRFPDTWTDSVNEILKRVNEPLDLNIGVQP